MQEPARGTPEALRKILADEEACILVFAKWRWPHGFVCPRCGGRDGRRITGRPAWRCASCDRQTRLTAGTALHRTRVPLSKWLYAIVLVGDRKQSVSALQLQKDLHFSCYRTAFKMLHIIRDVMDDCVTLTRGALEVALCRIGRRDARAPKEPEGVTLGIAIERLRPHVYGADADDSELPIFGRIQLCLLGPNADWYDVRRASLPGVTDVDFWPKPITRQILGNFLDWVQGTFHGVSEKYLAAYAREFSFRFNHRRHASIVPQIIGKRLVQRTARRRAELKNPRPLIPPPPPKPPPPIEEDDGDPDLPWTKGSKGPLDDDDE